MCFLVNNMISVRVINKLIKIRCSKNQLIDTEKLKYLYRTGYRFVSQNNGLPIIVELEENVKFSRKAQKMFDIIDSKFKHKTLIIIAG